MQGGRIVDVADFHDAVVRVDPHITGDAHGFIGAIINYGVKQRVVTEAGGFHPNPVGLKIIKRTR